MSKNFWMIRAGQGGYLLHDFETKRVVAIGWNQLGGLGTVRDREEMKDLCRKTFPKDKPGRVITTASVLHKFRNVVKKGDGVVTYDPTTREYLVGEITGEYRFDATLISDHGNVRDVAWQSRVSRDVLSTATRNSLGSTLTLFAITPEAWEDLQSAKQGGSSASPEIGETEKPDFEEIKKGREDEAHESLKDKLLELDDLQMQDLLAAVLRAMGFKTKVSRPGPDRGLDVLASPDGLGLQEPRIKAEVKHRGGTIGAPAVRSLSAVFARAIVRSI